MVMRGYGAGWIVVKAPVKHAAYTNVKQQLMGSHFSNAADSVIIKIGILY